MIKQARTVVVPKQEKGENRILQPRKKGSRSAILDSLYPVFTKYRIGEVPWNIHSLL